MTTAAIMARIFFIFSIICPKVRKYRQLFKQVLCLKLGILLLRAEPSHVIGELVVAAGRNPFPARECLHCIVKPHFAQKVNHVPGVDNRKAVLAGVGNQPLVIEHRPRELPVPEFGELGLPVVVTAVGEHQMAVGNITISLLYNRLAHFIS